MISKEEVLELLDEALARLPEELRAARWLLKEREEYLARVRHEGDEILDQARTRAERMVQRTEVVKAAEARAYQIVDTAEAEARRLHHEVEDFCDQKLASFEIVLERTMKLVASGRQKLQGTNLLGDAAPRSTRSTCPRRPTPATSAAADDELYDDQVDERSTTTFFDQDDAVVSGGSAAPGGRVRAAARTRAPAGPSSSTSCSTAWPSRPPRCRAGHAGARRPGARVAEHGAHRHRHGARARGRATAGAASIRSRARPRPRCTPRSSSATPTEGETYPLDGEQVDLEPLVRDAVLLALPLAPLCADDCPGPAPEAFPTGPADTEEPPPAIPAGPPSTSSRSTTSCSATRSGPAGPLRPERVAPATLSRSRPSPVPLRAIARARRRHIDSHDHQRHRRTMAVPKKKTSKAKSRSRRASAWTIKAPGPQHLPALRCHQAAPHRVRQLRLVPRPPGHRRRLTPAPATGDRRLSTAAHRRRRHGRRSRSRPPSSTGRRQAAAELGIPILLVGRPDEIGDPGDLEVLAASEVIAMDADAGVQRAPHEGLLARAGGRGRARRPGLGHGQRRQHRGHHGQRAAAHGPHQGRVPPGHRHARSPCWAARRR